MPDAQRRAASTSDAVGGSDGSSRSVIRTLPMSWLTAPSSSAAWSRTDPTTNSVEPPPMSNTRNGPSAAGRSPTAPRNDSAASSVPAITSGSWPRTPRTMARKSSEFDASRVADVAVIRTASAPEARITAA